MKPTKAQPLTPQQIWQEQSMQLANAPAPTPEEAARIRQNMQNYAPVPAALNAQLANSSSSVAKTSFLVIQDHLKRLRQLGYKVTCAEYVDGFPPDEEGCTYQQLLIDIDPETLSLHTPEDLAPFGAE